MPRILTGTGMLVALLAPALAFAAFDTVSLDTNTVFNVGAVTINVSGSPAAVESVVVNTNSTFSVTLLAGSTLQITAPGRESLAYDTTTGLTSVICNSTQSLLEYAPSSTVTVTVTPSSTLCQGGGGGSSGGGSSSSSGGSSSSASSATPATVATSTAPATPAVPATPATPASGLSSAQVTSILSLLASFDADSATIAQVQAALMGTGSTGASAPPPSSFKRNLDVGAIGSDVKSLQAFLNAHGYAVAKSGAGSLGKETTKFGPATRAALIKYQKAKGITPASGYFGPKTRAVVNAGS